MPFRLLWLRSFLILLILSTGLPQVGFSDVTRFVTGGLSPGPPASGGNRIYILSEDRYLYAFALSGVRLWRRDIGRLPRGPAVVGPDGTVYVTRDARGISAYNRRGTRLWDVDIPDIGGSPTVSPRGLLVVPHREGRISVFSPSGRLLNSFEGPGPLLAPPILTGGGYLALLDAQGRLTAMDGAGNRLWERRFSSPGTTAAAGSSGSVVLALSDGRVLEIDATGERRDGVRAPGALRQLRVGGSLLAGVLADGRIWVRNREIDRSWVAAPPEERITGIALSPEVVAAVTQRGGLYLFSQEGALLRQSHLPESAPLSDPVLLPEGGVAAVGANWVVYLFPTENAECAEPWGCPRGGSVLAGRRGGEGGSDLLLPEPRGDGNLERIYFEELLTSPDADERRRGLAAAGERLSDGRLGASRRFLIPLIAEVAGNPRRPGITSEERMEAISLLSAIGTYEAAGALAGLAGRIEDPHTVRALAEAIGGLGADPSGHAARALQVILRRNPEPQTAEAVIAAAGELVEYAGKFYSPAFGGIVTAVTEGSYPVTLKRRALSLGSFESYTP